VVGEGGNLGFSQRGRIEYARRGGGSTPTSSTTRPGVNTSDVEVNLKILLNGAVRAGEITRAARDRLLVQMTDEVAAPGPAQQLPAEPGDQHGEFIPRSA
jgi:glutamate dehydrogenase